MNTWLEKKVCTINDGQSNHYGLIIECSTLEENDIESLPHDWENNDASVKVWKERHEGINFAKLNHYHSIRMMEVLEDGSCKKMYYNIPTEKFSIVYIETEEQEIILFKLMHNLRIENGN